MRGLVCGLIVCLTLGAGAAAAQKSKPSAAVLVETSSLFQCASFDCPPWPTPADLDVCVEVDGVYYVGEYRPPKVPWATGDKRLYELTGQPVEVVISEKHIRIVGPQIDVKLTRAHHFLPFLFAACNAV